MAWITKIVTSLTTRLRMTLARLLLGPAADSDALALDRDARMAQTLRERERAAAAARAVKTLERQRLTVISGGLAHAETEVQSSIPPAQQPDLAAKVANSRQNTVS